MHVHQILDPVLVLFFADQVNMVAALQMSFSDSVFYYWSDKEWDSCDKFRDVATSVLNPRGVPDMLEWSASDTQVLHSIATLLWVPTKQLKVLVASPPPHIWKAVASPSGCFTAGVH